MNLWDLFGQSGPGTLFPWYFLHHPAQLSPSKLSILPPSPSWQSLLVAFLLNYSKFLKRKWNNICMYSFLIVLQPVSIPWVLHIYSVFLILLYIHGWTVVYNWFHIPSQDLEQSSFCNSFHFRIWRIFWSFNTSAIIPHH